MPRFRSRGLFPGPPKASDAHEYARKHTRVVFHSRESDRTNKRAPHWHSGDGPPPHSQHPQRPNAPAARAQAVLDLFSRPVCLKT